MSFPVNFFKMSSTVEIGRQAEQLAENFLISKGYQVLKTNWRSGQKEIDIICIFMDQLIIVEVKSRFHTIHPVVREVVGLKKQRNLILATEVFIKKFNIDLPTRFDIISVLFHGFEFDIEHMESAFFPEAE